MRRSEVKWLAQGHTASSGVRIQTQEAELQSPGCNDKAMPRLRLCPAAPQRHRAVHSQPPPQRLGRGQRSAVSGQQSRALGCPALPIFVFDNYLSSEQLGTSPKTECGWDNKQQMSWKIFSPRLYKTSHNHATKGLYCWKGNMSTTVFNRGAVKKRRKEKKNLLKV